MKHNANPLKLDSHTWAFFLEVPPARVVLLQSCFETYEGLGTVRTLGEEKPIVCVLTSEDSREDCLAALQSLLPQTGWRLLPAQESALLDTDKFLNGEPV